MSAHDIEISFLPVGCGDAIRIRFLGNDTLYHNILVDGGTYKGNIYETTLQKEIQDIITKNEIIDLWIITHIDDDHIGGVLRFIKDKTLNQNVDLKRTTFWFNYSVFDYDTGIKDTNLKSVSQGILLREFLKQNALLVEKITDASGAIDFYGAILTVLSPNKSKYEALIKSWENEEVKIQKKETAAFKSASGYNDYSIKMDDFNLDNFDPDKSPENASSISFLFEYHNTKTLFLADSLPFAVTDSLERMNYSESNKLVLNLMQMPHHGNKRNLNNKLLQLIQCFDFVISSNGFNTYHLPNKEALVRVVHNFPKQKVNFFITHKNQLTESIFDVDGNPSAITLNFPQPGRNAITFKQCLI